MVTFFKVEIIPSYYPTLGSTEYISPIPSCLLGDASNMPLDTFTQDDVSSQNKP